MRITAVETLPPTIGHRTHVFVKIHTDAGAGIVGIGEAACSDKERAHFGAIDDLHQYLIGSNPFEIEKLWSLMHRHSFWRFGPVLGGGASPSRRPSR